MDFLELRTQFESKLNNTFKFERLELHYMPYSFGTGIIAYRIKGRLIRIIYNGRDNEIEVYSSKPHEKYPNASWAIIFTGHPSELLDKGITRLNELFGIK